ncbi:MAG: EVE domain-containing protein [Minisyncoccia bacterium]
MNGRQYWLMKSEGDCYSIDDLCHDKVTSWDGVRNYQARNFMMRDMHMGDGVLFYHSNGTPSGVYGIAEIVSNAHPDISQFKQSDMHFEPKATKEKPIWYCVDVGFLAKARNPLSLALIKADPALQGMAVRMPASRLSIQPVSEKHFNHIVKLIA